MNIFITFTVITVQQWEVNKVLRNYQQVYTTKALINSRIYDLCNQEHEVGKTDN